MKYVWPDDISILERRDIINSQFARMGDSVVDIVRFYKEGQTIFAVDVNKKRYRLTVRGFGKLPPMIVEGGRIPAQTIEIDLKLTLEPCD
jgi:hypothetical protein